MAIEIVADDTQRQGSSSDRMLSVMDLFTPERPEWTVDQACAVMGQSESTVYRYFRSLAAVGLIFSIRPGRYLLGPGIIHYERQLRVSDPLIRVAQPVIEEMAAKYHRSGAIFISYLYRESVMTTHERWIGAEPFSDGSFARGRLAPLFRGAPGLALLASFDIRTVRSIHQRVGSGDAEWLDFKRRMRAVRALGYAATVGDPDEGVTYISVPLQREGLGVAGVLSIALTDGSDTTTDIDEAAALLFAAADGISTQARMAAQD